MHTRFHALGQLAVGRGNNLNLIRFVAASLVLVTHSFALSTGNPAVEPLRDSLGLTLGSIAVDVFFVASGFLIAGSLEHTSSLKSFFVARCLRIYPALWVMLLLLTFVMGPIVTGLSLGEYFTAKGLYIYLAKGSTLIGGITHQLPGVFLDTPYPGAVNGSLWTLPYEVRCYLMLAFFYWATSSVVAMSPKARRSLLTAIALGLLLVTLVAGTALRKSFPGVYLASVFLMGSALYLNRHVVKVSWLSVLSALAVVFAAAASEPSLGLFHYVYPVLIGYIVLGLAYLPSGVLLNYNRLGDYSYGMYIYAFPVQQLYMNARPDTTPWSLTMLAFPATLVLAVCSWHAVEKPALELKKKLQGVPKSGAIGAVHDVNRKTAA